MQTADVQNAENQQETGRSQQLSSKSTVWCRKVATLAARRILSSPLMRGRTIDIQSLNFYVLPGTFRSRLSNCDDKNNIFLSREFFNERFNLVKGLSRELRVELKALIFRELVRFFYPNETKNYYRLMTKCNWHGPRVQGALGSQDEARQVLTRMRAESTRTVEEVPTGLTETVTFYDLVTRSNVVQSANIFVMKPGLVKIARCLHEGRKLRCMLPGGKDLAKRLGL